ncbi:MAG: VWA domain-containing protein [Candidatus Acidiferrales bacterium]|jgi:VWFA-related protein
MIVTARPARLGWAIFAVLLCGAAALAQQNAAPTSPAPPAPAASTADKKITLDVVVSPKSGPPVADLQQQDFTVLDNNAPQTITSFKAVSGREAPIEVVLVIDAVNASYQTVSVARPEIDKFLRAEGGRLAYPVALVLFTDKGTQSLGSFSTDGNALSAALDDTDVALRSITRAAGFYGATDRFQLSIRTLGQLVSKMASVPGRKLMLWVSPGWPLLSGPRVELDSKQQHEIFANIVTLSTQLLQARVTLYNINPLGNSESIGRVSYYKDFVKGVSKPSQVAVGDLGLPVLATQSGGLVLNFNNDIASLLRECLSDSAPYYEISFDPPPGDKRDEYHHLEIKLAKPGLTARARQGYYSQPSQPN